MSYTERPHREVKVFDLKQFVIKLREEQSANMNPTGNIITGMPNIPGFNPMAGGFPIPGNRPTNNMSSSLDEYVKRLDEK